MAAPISADGDDGEALALGRIAGPKDVRGDEIVQRLDDFIGDLGQQPRRLQPAGAILQPLLGDHAAAEQGVVQQLPGAQAQILLAHAVKRGGGKLHAQLRAIDDVFYAGGAKAKGHGLYIVRLSGSAPGEKRLQLENEVQGLTGRQRLWIDPGQRLLHRRRRASRRKQRQRPAHRQALFYPALLPAAPAPRGPGPP